MDYCEKEGLRNTDKEECLNSCNVEGDVRQKYLTYLTC